MKFTVVAVGERVVGVVVNGIESISSIITPPRFE